MKLGSHLSREIYPQRKLPTGQLMHALPAKWLRFECYDVPFAVLCLFVCTLMHIKSQCVTCCLPLFTLCGLTHVIFWPQIETNVNNSHQPRPSMGITPRPKIEGQAGLCQIWPKSILWAVKHKISKLSNPADNNLIKGFYLIDLCTDHQFFFHKWNVSEF